MTTDFENHLRRALARAELPAALWIDSEEVARHAARDLRRRRVGRGVGTGLLTTAAAAGLIWSMSAVQLPGDDVEPAGSAGCTPSTLPVESSAVLLLTGSARVLVAATDGCGVPQIAFGSGVGTTEVQVTGSYELSASSSGQALLAELEVDGDRLIAAALPDDARSVAVIGPDRVRWVDDEALVPVPDSGLVAFVIEEPPAGGRELAVTWQRPDGTTATSWSAGVTARAWSSGVDPSRAQSWVARDRSGQLWVQHDGRVVGPIEPQARPHALAVGDVLVVVVPEAGGQLVDPDSPADTFGDLVALEAEGSVDIQALLLHVDDDSAVPLWRDTAGQLHEIRMEP